MLRNFLKSMIIWGNLLKNEINKYNENIPKVFEISYGACLGPLKYFSLKIDGKILRIPELLLFPGPNEIIPTDEEWKDFWKKMDQLGIWKWLKEYSPQYTYVSDGYYWKVNMELGDKKIESSGFNAYPGDNGEIVDMSMTRSFKIFLDAVEILTGLEIERYDD